MSVQIDTERGPIYFISNHKPRAVVSYLDLPEAEQKNFDYTDAEEHSDYRFFEYLGSWYDLSEFTTDTTDEMRARGFDGISTDSYFSATVVKWFDADGIYTPSEGEIVVGRIHW